jgi:hypothetical protein
MRSRVQVTTSKSERLFEADGEEVKCDYNYMQRGTGSYNEPLQKI